MHSKPLVTLLAVLIVLSACTPGAPSPEQNSGTAIQTLKNTTPYSLLSPTPAVEAPSPTPVSFADLEIWIDHAVPSQLQKAVAPFKYASSAKTADIHLGLVEAPAAGVEWIYALTAPFSSLLDAMSFADLQSAWQGGFTPAYDIFLEESTLRALERVLGLPGASVQVLPADELLAAGWEDENALALLPFEMLEPRWKVIGIDGQSPVRNDFETDRYPLKATFGWQGEPEKLAVITQAVEKGVLQQLTGNRDPSRMTVLVMTGVTALVRATAVKMEEKGITYPGEDIRDWLVNADLTHISNEVSFSPLCPDPTPDPMPLIFCSKPEYIELLDFVGTDILELTGNHGVDWGREALIYSLELYEDRGWHVYAAGENSLIAREAVKVEHNGNKLAFIGCNPAGPEYIWATETDPGVANCDYPWMWQRIGELTDEGYQVIATFQYFETYRHYVEPFEERDFRSMADAGAVIVSGSQSHHPMAMEFYKGSFIHYGLGNLFFDQMHTGGLIQDATRKEFIDRYVFYNNQHISTELLTAMLEDYSRPRPMTSSERYDFLTEIFAVTDWGDVP